MYYPATLKSGGMTAERAPEALQGLEWVVMLQRVQGRPVTTPAGPGRACCPPCHLLEQSAYLGQ